MSDERKERLRSVPEKPEMAGFSGLQQPLAMQPEQREAEQALRALDESVSGFARVAEAIRAAKARLHALSEQVAGAGAAGTAVDTSAYQAEIERHVQTLVVLEHDLEALRHNGDVLRAQLDLAREREAQLDEQIAAANHERDLRTLAYNEARGDYERQTRELIALRGESFVAFLRRKWSKLFGPAPSRSE